MREATPEDVAAIDGGTYTGDGDGDGLGGGGTVSGTWMAETWNDLQVQYQVSGATFDAPTEEEWGGSGSGFTEVRQYMGTLDGGTLTVTGTATSGREKHSSTYPSRVRVRASNLESEDVFTDETDPDEGPWTVSFSVSIPTPISVATATFSVSLTYVNPTYGDRQLLVSGTATR